LDNKHRGALVTLTMLCLMLVSFTLGAWIGTSYFIPENSGLAGPFMALGYGIVGALAGLAVGVLFVRKLRIEYLNKLVLPLLLAGAVCGYLVVSSYFEARHDYQQQLEQRMAALPPFTLQLEYLISERDMPLLGFDYDTNSERFTAIRGDNSVCSGRIPADSNARVALIAALRHLETLLGENSELCAADAGEIFFNLSFRITENPVSDSSGSIGVTGDCLKRYKEIYNIASTIERVYMEYRNDCN